MIKPIKQYKFYKQKNGYEYYKSDDNDISIGNVICYVYCGNQIFIENDLDYFNYTLGNNLEYISFDINTFINGDVLNSTINYHL